MYNIVGSIPVWFWNPREGCTVSGGRSQRWRLKFKWKRLNNPLFYTPYSVCSTPHNRHSRWYFWSSWHQTFNIKILVLWARTFLWFIACDLAVVVYSSSYSWLPYFAVDYMEKKKCSARGDAVEGFLHWRRRSHILPPHHITPPPALPRPQQSLPQRPIVPWTLTSRLFT